MTGIHDFWLFVGSGLLLNLLPGPDSLYVIARGASQGARAGAVAGLGIAAGCMVHVTAAALGLSALLAASATAFTVLKLVGAAYLLWMGLGLLRGPAARAPARPAPPAPARLRQVFAQGVLTNVLNPKVALFFLAFVPQFIDAGASHKGRDFLLLGAVFDIDSLPWLMVLAIAASTLRARLSPSARVVGALGRLTGALFVWLGLRLAWASR